MIKKTVQGVQSREEEFDITDRLIRVKDTDGSEIFYEYNVTGDLISVADDKQILTTIYYDSLGRKTQMTDANLGTWKYEYDFKGRLSKQTDAKDQKINNYYDDLGRLTTKVVWFGNILDRQEIYTYDKGSNGYDVKLGELYQVEEFNSANKLMRTTRFGYEPAFRSPTRISRKIVGLGEFTQEIFNDVKGRVTKNIYPGGDTIYYTYNLTGGLMKSCNTADCKGEVYQSVDPNTGYDVYGSLLKETFGNGVTNDYEYYPLSHRLKQRTITSNQVIASQRQYTFDGYSNITNLNDPQKLKGSASWSIINYDNLNRLTSYKSTQTGKTESLNYDARGNILKNTASYANKDYEYTTSRPHAVSKIGDDKFFYDANGNMITDNHRMFMYNAQNQLTKVTMKNETVAEYAYDYTGAGNVDIDIDGIDGTLDFNIGDTGKLELFF